jgi:hypothetical protein
MPSTAPTLVAASAVLMPVPPEPTPDPSPLEAVVVDPVSPVMPPELTLLPPVSLPPALTPAALLDALLPLPMVEPAELIAPLPPPPPHESSKANSNGDKPPSNSLEFMSCCRQCPRFHCLFEICIDADADAARGRIARCLDSMGHLADKFVMEGAPTLPDEFLDAFAGLHGHAVR